MATLLTETQAASQVPELPDPNAAPSAESHTTRRPAVRRTVAVLVIIAVALYASIFVRAWLMS